MKASLALTGSLLQSLSLGIFLGNVPVASGKPLHLRSAETSATATSPLDSGSVKGLVDSYGNSVYLGIPFAETTGGNNRYVSDGSVKGAYFFSQLAQMEGAHERQEAEEG
jgi:hypothetical protein